MGGEDESDSSTTWDFGGEETQIFESPNSSFGNKFDGDEADPFHTLQSTLPFEDTVRCEDELATQVMDLEDETQLFNLAVETQVVNFDDDIEEMDIADTIENNETQLFNDCDTEEVADTDNEGTEVLGVSDEETDDDSTTHLCKNDRKEHESETNCGTSGQLASVTGDGSKTFTSIRAASLRASGLAALKKASQESQSPSRLKLSTEPDIERRIPEHDKLIDRPGNGSKSGFGRSTARKLFSDDSLDNTDDDIALGGLSYIDSQEPGDASQANALDFVDNFLKINIESGEKSDINKSTGGKSKPVLTAKGTQVFAKSATLISAVDKRSIFNFDDNCEDDGEPEFFKKKKEVFFGSGSRKAKSSVSSGKGRKVGEPRRKNMTGLVCSDSKVVLGIPKSSDKPKKSLGKHIKDLTLRKNLINELDEQATDIPLPSGTDIQENTEARFDTQMAAEAMEDLCAIQTRAPPLRNEGTRTTRSKSKSKLTGDQPKEVKKWTKSTAKRKVAVSESKNLDKSDVAKRKGNLSLKRRAAVAPETIVDQTSVKKQCIQNVTPVACRTRKSIVKDSNKVEIAPSCPTEKISIPIGFHPKGKRSSPKSSSTRLTRSKAAISTKQEKGSLKERREPVSSTCTTPVNRTTPVKESSPVCMGDEYLKQSWRKSRIRASLIQEVRSLSPVGTSILSPSKDTRERRDISLICVLFSRHLDGDIIKQQKKILSRLGASETSSMSDATHFIADDFVRTRNMLEAIALGKPVVTHLWLQSCGEACCHIDEKSFILRDAKKEKEIGFSLPTSLARARQSPLLKGQRVLITPNTKPGKEILISLVKAVHGVVVERMGRTAMNDDKISEGLLILSCEEDYAVCAPFLEKGAAVYSSELLLNGIVTQRLDYERLESDKADDDESHLLNLPPHVLEMLMEFCAGVEYLKFRSTCKRCHLAAPLIPWNNGKASKIMQKYSLPSPWLIVFDKHKGIITLTDPVFDDKYFINTPQELICDDFQIMCSRFGWLLSLKPGGSLMFFNPFTSVILELPELPDTYIICFSGPPTSPDCMVVGITLGGSTLCQACIHIVGGEPSWRRTFLNVFGDEFINSIKFYGRDLYALREDGGFDVFREMGREKHAWWRDLAKAPASCCTSLPECFHLRCDRHILRVIVGKFGESVEVFILTVSQKWLKVVKLRKHMIFICGESSVCLDAKTPQMENKIYFPTSPIMYYSLETCRFHTLNNQDSFRDFFGTKHHLSPHGWIEPSWS